MQNLTHITQITIEYNEYIYEELKKLYPKKINLGKDELAEVLNLSSRTISNRMSLGTLKIKHIKTGSQMQSGVVFPLVAVAEYLTYELALSEQFAA